MTKQDWVQVYEESVEELKPSAHSNINADFYSSNELRSMGIQCGVRCLVHKTCVIVNPAKLSLGNDVRIDAYTLISAGIGVNIGSFVHIASHTVLMGGAGIEILDYASIASGSKVFSVSDDIMGRGVVGPCVDDSKRFLHKGKILLAEHTVLAVNTVVMPGSVLDFGAILLPFSLLIGKTEQFSVNSGSPAKFVKERRKDFLQKL